MKNKSLTAKEIINIYGADGLTDISLLAALTGAKEEVVSEMVRDFKGLPNTIINFEHYSKSLTPTQIDKFIMLKEVIKRNNSYAEKKQTAILSPAIAYDIIKSHRFETEEVVILLLMNTKNELIKKIELSRGSLNASIIHPREVFKYAVKYNANTIMLAHNHPSGDTTPSEEDIQITKRIIEAGEIMGINLLDHLIISPGTNSYLSFKEMRYID